MYSLLKKTRVFKKKAQASEFLGFIGFWGFIGFLDKQEKNR